jgi:hypothetical protein
MNARNQRTQIGNDFFKGLDEGFPSSDQHIVMVRHKVTRACCHSRPKATFYAIAFRGIAGLLGHGKADARLGLFGSDHLQPKCRPPGAIAPGSPLKLRTFDEPTQGVRLLLDGRHAATEP